jgi:hypothetical protein
MIVKGKVRDGGAQLATYLIDNGKQENEQVTVLEVKSGLTQDPKKALRDMDIATMQTKGKLGLYHCMLNPAAGERLTSEQWQDAIDSLEKEIGFEGQNRVLVMHEKLNKEGQLVEHVHVVWQRERDGKLLQLGNNYKKHDKVREQLEVKLKLERTPQAKETKQALTDIWNEAKDGRDFVELAGKQGFIIAAGDSRAYMVQTPEGKILNLTKQLPKEVKQKAVIDRLKDAQVVKESELTGKRPLSEKQLEKTRRTGQEVKKNSPARPEKVAGEKGKDLNQFQDRFMAKIEDFRTPANDNEPPVYHNKAEWAEARIEKMRAGHEARAAHRAEQAGDNFKDVLKQEKAGNDNSQVEAKAGQTRAERAAEQIERLKDRDKSKVERQAEKNIEDIAPTPETEAEKRLRRVNENRQDFGLEVGG